MLYKNYLEYLKLYISLLLPKYLKKVTIEKNQLVLSVPSSYIREISLILRDHNNLLFKVLVDIIGVDFLERKSRFELCYCFLSVKYHSRLILKVNLEEHEAIPSITNIFNNADWYEREVWDLFGIIFTYHPDLRRILTDYGFQGFPFRKDFPLSGYVEMAYDPVTQQVRYVPVKFIQEFRKFNYQRPWGYKLDDSVVGVNKIKLLNYRSILFSSIKKYIIK